MSTIVYYNTRFLTSPSNYKNKTKTKNKTKQNKNETKQTKNTEQTNKIRENSKHVIIAAHTLAVNIFETHTSVTNEKERWI